MKSIIGRNFHNILIVVVWGVLFLITGCGQARQQVTPRGVLSANEINTFASDFDSLLKKYWEVCAKHDLKQVRTLYTEDIKVIDAGDTVMEGSMYVSGVFCSTFYMVYPGFEGRSVANYIDRDGGVYIEDTWGWSLRSEIPIATFSENRPMTTYMWFTTRDGLIARVWMLYGEEVFAELDETPFPGAILKDYSTAWSSNRPQKIAELYSSDAVYRDSLFRDNIQGVKAIEEFASKYFAWYPDIRVKLVKSFGHYPSASHIGGLFTMDVLDRNGGDCSIQKLIFLHIDPTTQKILEEWVFYQPDLLLACGWAQ